ncbi:MAG: hypothetical protein ACJ77E_09705 [Gaiellaceae bacterium]
MKTLSPVILVVALAALLAGCGGGGGSSSASSGTPNGGGGVNGISVGNCLNEDENFLVQPSEKQLDGQSPAGVSFTLTFYKTDAAAKAAAAKKNPKFTALVPLGVVDFKGNPSPFAGAPPAKISKVELAAIKSCIEKAKSAS